MARWKLMNNHHLRTIGNEWEYKEIDRTTGREVRKRIEVPRYLDVNDQHDWTNSWGNKDNQEGEIIVCHEGKGDSRDVVFFGDPTPDMMPIDDEAKAISATFEKRWNYSPETDFINAGYSQSLIDNFQRDMADKAAAPVEIPGLSDLVAAMVESNKNTAELIKASARRA